MAYDEALAGRIRAALGSQPGVVEKKMFGGLAFLVHGNMCVGVNGTDMIVRLAPAESADALEQRHTRVFDLTGRPMKGWIVVGAPGVTHTTDVAGWVQRALRFVTALPAK